MNDTDAMRMALQEAECALRERETPVGCVIVRQNRVIARAHNARERSHDPTAHAEILALRQAADVLRDWRLNDCALYVTLEPCPMCAGAILMSRIRRVVFGAYDPMQGCAGSVYRITEDPAFSHFCPADGGILQEECQNLLSRFFRENRQ